jgi:glucose-1-phosphate cytidylyltransferase
MANYADGLSDLPLDQYVGDFLKRDKLACFVSVRPHHAFHIVDTDADGLVTKIEHVGASNVRLNGGFFIFRRQIFDFIRDGEELVEEPFARLIAERQLIAYRYDGFWQSMDTFKDKQRLDDLWARGDAPWDVRKG